jgi:hypothetical protein
LTFLYPVIIQSISEKNDETEGLTDLVSENDIPFNLRQRPAVCNRTLAIH